MVQGLPEAKVIDDFVPGFIGADKVNIKLHRGNMAAVDTGSEITSGFLLFVNGQLLNIGALTGEINFTTEGADIDHFDVINTSGNDSVNIRKLFAFDIDFVVVRIAFVNQSAIGHFYENPRVQFGETNSITEVCFPVGDIFLREQVHPGVDAFIASVFNLCQQFSFISIVFVEFFQVMGRFHKVSVANPAADRHFAQKGAIGAFKGQRECPIINKFQYHWGASARSTSVPLAGDAAGVNFYIGLNIIPREFNIFAGHRHAV